MYLSTYDEYRPTCRVHGVILLNSSITSICLVMCNIIIYFHAETVRPSATKFGTVVHWDQTMETSG